MKKIILLILLSFTSFIGFAQLPTLESFSTGIPSNWAVFDNGVGTAESWGITSAPASVYSTPSSAEVLRGQIGIGNTSQDWMVTNLQAIPANGQFRFFTRSNIAGDAGTIYQIRVSTTSQTDPATFTTIQTYTELDLSAIANVYEEKIISLAAYGTQSIYIAFVRVHTQTGNAASGDKWLVDNVKIVQQCPDPTVLTATNIGSTIATLGWTSTAPLFDVQYGPSGFALGTGTIQIDVTNPYNATGLTAGIPYQFYVKAKCASGVESAWTGPFNFVTKPFGSVCADPIVISALPYQVITDNTGNYGDDTDVIQGTLCGATPATTNYLAGDEVFYSFTASADGPISITMTPQGTASTNSSVFVYASCNNANTGGSCLGGLANSGTGVRVVNLTVTAGVTYIVVISSSATTQTVTYGLLIQQEVCTPKPTALAAGNFNLTTVDLSWASTYTTGQIAVQPLGSTVPTGSIWPTTNGTTYPATGLTAATQYQFWVRGECAPGSGTFTAWAGPFPFNTAICNPVDACTHIFRMTDSANNGWNGARMEVRQNGIVVATIGSTYNSGAGPVDIPVQLCNGVPFDLYWSVAGTQPQQCIVAIINSFGQTIYTKAAGVSSVASVVYTNTVNCITPLCNLAPTATIATNIANYSATIGWTAPATTAWDIYLVPTGTPAPTPSTTPTYANVTTNPFDVVGLLADNTYCVYVRVVCSPEPSPWSAVYCFTTLPTCPKPTALTAAVATITTTQAVLGWANGVPTDTQWEILLVKALATNDYGTPPPPPINPVLALGDVLYAPVITPSPFTATGLTPATIYYYYIRTVCSATDKSTWAGPVKFNTLTCDVADKCNYQFVMTDTGSNGWNGGRMQVRQNGIVVATIGSTITGAGPTTVTVALCNNVPFDLYWTIPGTAADQIGLTIRNPFTDIIYTMAPGVVTPPTGTPVVPVIVYASTGNCTPPTCPKPTALLVTASATTQTSVELSWTEMGTATQWEVYVVTAGSPPPVNGTPVSTGIPPYYIANTNPFTVTGLLPSTSYIYYVRAICSLTDVGTWTILNPKTFITKPVNDECAFATPVPVNPTKVCAVSVAGTTLGATGSLPVTSPVCPGNPDDDVWYSFVATNNIHIITLSNIVGGTTDLNHTLYSGSDCATQTQLYCSNPNVSVAVNLIPGTTYKVRVYTNGAVATQTATFDICITTPPPITNDECATATPAATNTGLVCTVVTPGTITGASASVDASTCTGFEDDDVWFSFVANATTQYLSLINVVGTSIDLNHAVYSGVCGSLVQKYCSAAGSLTSNNATFVIGQTYYIRVWSNSNALQDITFDLCIGRILPPITASITQYTTVQLVEEVLLNTTCASVTNVTSSTGSNFGSVNGIGSFNGIGSDFPFADGVILSTGAAMSTPGPNLTGLSEGNTAWPGDAQLTAILAAATPPVTINSRNASVLEFDFVPLASQLSFNFIFASEEYGTFQCSFSDSFAFILTDLTIAGPAVNLAVLPGTATPISVVTMRNNAFNAGCASVNPQYFATYYGTPFPPGVNPLGAPINFNGVSVPLTATGPIVSGHQYHIKLVIADQSDTAFDSAVFLEGGSFDIGNVELGNNVDGADSLCPGSTLTLNSNLNPADYTISWTQDGVIIPGQTSPTLLVTAPGVYGINAQYGTSTCFAADFITVAYFTDAVAGVPNNLIICNASGTEIFDLTQNTAVILAPFADTIHTVAYFASNEDASANTNPIATPTAYTNTSNPQTIYARVTNTTTDCFQIVTFQLIVQDLTPQFTLLGQTAICPDGTTVISVVPTNNNFDTSLVSYEWTFNGVVIPGQTGVSLSISGSAGYGTYTVTVNNSGCTSTQTFEITNSNTVWDFTITAPATLCPDEIGTLTVTVNNNNTGAPAEYTYTLPDLSTIVTLNNSIAIDTDGTYTVNVNILGCETSQTIVVGQSVSNWIFTITAPAALCPDENGTLTVNVTNNTTGTPATYTYTLPDLSTVVTTNNSIPIDAPGTYSVAVNILGCINSQSIVVGDSNTIWEVTFVNTPYEICPGQPVTLSFTADNFDIASATYTWTLPDATQATGATLTANQLGDYTLEINNLGCITTETVSVSQSGTVVTVLIEEGCNANNYQLTAVQADGTPFPNATYAWTGPSINPAEANTSTITLSTAGEYYVTVTVDGCSGTADTSPDNIGCNIQQGISPNNDGDNDYFDLSTLKVKHLSIFNRYGMKVYSYGNYTNQWYGTTDKGEELPDGTYYYVIERENVESVTGWIYVIHEN